MSSRSVSLAIDATSVPQAAVLRSLVSVGYSSGCKPFLCAACFDHSRSSTSENSQFHPRLQNTSMACCAHASADVKALCRALGLRPTPVPATSLTGGPGKPVPSLCGTTTAMAQTCPCLSCLPGHTVQGWPAAAMCSRQWMWRCSCCLVSSKMTSGNH